MLDHYAFMFSTSHEVYETEKSFCNVVSALEDNSDVVVYGTNTGVFEDDEDTVMYEHEGDLATLRNYGDQIHVEGGEDAKGLLDKLDFSKVL